MALDHPTPPEGARLLEEWPKAPSMNKLRLCLEALSMSPGLYELGGGQLCVLGIRREITLAVEVRYDPGKTPSGRFSAKFAGAKVHDPVGVVVDSYVDYSIGKRDAKMLHLTEEKARKLGDRRNAEYNTGDHATFKVAMFSTPTALNTWLDEWLDLLKIEHKRQSPQKKPKPTNADLLMGATWSQKGALS